MAKRRTRKEKTTAKHQFTVHWDPSDSTHNSEAKKSNSEPNVKGQFSKSSEAKAKTARMYDNAKQSANTDDLKQIKHDIVKSLVLASLIIGIEVVLYLALNN